MILRRDPRLIPLLTQFESKISGDNSFIEKIHDLILTESESLYLDLFVDTSLEVGKTLSKDEREKNQLSQEKSLIYGEVEYNSFYRVLRKINAKPGLVFYDLGSGTGKAVFAARLTQDFSKCIGIEILKSLHTQASKIVKRYKDDFEAYLSLSNKNQGAQVFEGSFLDFDWSDGDVVFANSTCFDDQLMHDMSVQAENLKPGAIVVTFTKGLSLMNNFELLERKRYKMSWGPATVFIHRRLNFDGTAVGNYKLNILPSDNVSSYDDDSASANTSSSVYSAVSSDSMIPQVGSSNTSNKDDSTYEDDDIDYLEDDDDDNDDDEDFDNAQVEALYKELSKLRGDPTPPSSPRAQSNYQSPKPVSGYPYYVASPLPPDVTGKKASLPLKLPVEAILNDGSGSGFEGMTSPQDSALLMRKRNQQMRLKSRSAGGY